MRRYITFAFGLLLAAAVSAQNLNPTVQVTNAYEGKLMEVEKQNLPMAVPDSLTQFDWNFNYSVFDNPYKGAYEFNPYLIEMKPDSVPYDGKNLYVRVGAGYSLHPELQAVWSPSLKSGLKLSVYDNFKGYWGKYHALNTAIKGDLQPADEFKGHDSGNRFGVSARYDFKPVILSLDGKFDWMNSNGMYDAKNNVLGESVSLRARSNEAKAFLFDVEAGFKNLAGHSEWTPLPQILYSSFLPKNDFPILMEQAFGETGFNTDGKFSYRLSKLISVGVSASYDNLLFKTDGINIHSGLLNVIPSLSYSTDRFTVTAGMKYSDVFKGYEVEKSKLITDEDGVPYYPMADYMGKKFYPQAHIAVEAVEDALQLFADVTGGKRFNSYSNYLESNHFFSGQWAVQYPTFLGDASVNTIDASLGLSSHIRSRLQFSVKGGYARWYNLPMESLVCSYIAYMAGTGKCDYDALFNYAMVNMDLYYGELNAIWKSDRLDFSGLFRLQKSDFTRSAGAMSLPHFTGSADLTYNWNRRLFAGVTAEWATRRACMVNVNTLSLADDGCEDRISAKGWVDLGVSLEYRITSGMSLWLKGGNLLNQAVMRNLLIAEKGPYGTLGICLNL